MTSDTIWRWYCSVNGGDSADHGEPILEMRRRLDRSRGYEPVLIEDTSDSGLPELDLS